VVDDVDRSVSGLAGRTEQDEDTLEGKYSAGKSLLRYRAGGGLLAVSSGGRAAQLGRSLCLGGSIVTGFR
jgi:hypothetical protein